MTKVPSFPLDRKRNHKMLTVKDVKRLPRLGGTEGQLDQAVAQVKLFGMGSRYTFYITEYDGDDILWGYCVSPLGPDCDEWGYASLEELAEAERGGVPLIERDMYFEPQTVAECIRNGE